MRHNNDDAIAYGWLFILIFLIFGGITILAVFALENNAMTQINNFISQGTVSSQTANAITFQRNIGMGLPIIALLGAFLWGMMRGVQSRSREEPTSSAFYTGWIILISCCVTGFLLAWCG
jgi:hypothetical protein